MQIEKVVQHFGQKEAVSLNSGQIAQSVLMELGNKWTQNYLCCKKCPFSTKQEIPVKLIQ